MSDQTDRLLTFDEAEAAGFDGTGRDGDPRFPFHLSDLPYLAPASHTVATWAAGGRPWKLGEAGSFGEAVRIARSYVQASGGSRSAWINGDGHQWTVAQSGDVTQVR